MLKVSKHKTKLKLLGRIGWLTSCKITYQGEQIAWVKHGGCSNQNATNCRQHNYYTPCILIWLYTYRNSVLKKFSWTKVVSTGNITRLNKTIHQRTANERQLGSGRQTDRLPDGTLMNPIQSLSVTVNKALKLQFGWTLCKFVNESPVSYSEFKTLPIIVILFNSNWFLSTGTWNHWTYKYYNTIQSGL